MDKRIEVVRIEIGKLELKPNDILVIRFDERMISGEIKETVAFLRKSMPDGFSNHIWLFHGDIKLEVIESHGKIETIQDRE